MTTRMFSRCSALARPIGVVAAAISSSTLMNEQPSKSSRWNHSSKTSKIASSCSSGVVAAPARLGLDPAVGPELLALLQEREHELVLGARSAGRASPSRRRRARSPRRRRRRGRRGARTARRRCRGSVRGRRQALGRRPRRRSVTPPAGRPLRQTCLSTIALAGARLRPVPVWSAEVGGRRTARTPLAGPVSGAGAVVRCACLVGGLGQQRLGR